jgi:hypothetical protein
MNSEKTKYFYIYNFEQSKFFIDSGVPIVEIGKGSRDEVYHKFLRDEKAEQVFTVWVNRNK